jgi:hypothetical protein
MSKDASDGPFDDSTHWVGKLPEPSKKERETDEDPKKHSQDGKAD